MAGTARYEQIPDDEPLRVGKSSKSGFSVKKLVLVIFLALFAGYLTKVTFFSHSSNSIPHSDKPVCPIPSKVAIKEHDAIQSILNDKEYHKGVIDRFSKAIQVDTVVFDKMKDYSKMGKFHEYLEKSYPLVYKHAEVYKVNKYGLVFYFPGSDSSLKPIMMAAHQDTVPIGDKSDWTEDPFSGRFDGKDFHGRGASDCKNLLVGLIEAAEKLVADKKTDFKRGFILAFGFDEEKSGWDGAYNIGKFLVEKFGPNSIESITDEGPSMFNDILGGYYSIIPTGEKGYVDIQVKVNAPGGHSSLPGDHTSIGMLSSFLSDYEDDMYTPILTEENPMMNFFECLGEHADNLPKSLAQAARNVRYDSKAREVVLDYSSKNKLLKYNVRTSQAIDMIDGGDKANSLPREVSAVINHRISYGNSMETLWEKFTKHAKNAVEKYDIGLIVDGKEIAPKTDNGVMEVSKFVEELVPAPTTSYTDDLWFEFTGLIKAFYEDEIYPGKFDSGKGLVFAAALMSGNTDTRHYWNLTDHIYRVQPGAVNLFNEHVHGNDEVAGLDTHLQIISFYYNYISHFCL
ncbi:hypothetical protein CANINC_001527 [Pichia inconspicua]|uniref:Peptidase M20 dimerisation domain-containing protein n=1 Tax=Pichia inconspicua TaxID=52247 RepID=A0A4T0X3H4_9ASCO|nr:hypothetical protein CANINC_001527 [[Candida] inconspicua]